MTRVAGVSAEPASDQLVRLADRLGVATAYWDWQQHHVRVPASTLVAVLDALGVDASDDDAVARAHRDLDDAPWRRTLPRPSSRARAGRRGWRCTSRTAPGSPSTSSSRAEAGVGFVSSTTGSSRARSTASSSARRPSSSTPTSRSGGTASSPRSRAATRRTTRRRPPPSSSPRRSSSCPTPWGSGAPGSPRSCTRSAALVRGGSGTSPTSGRSPAGRRRTSTRTSSSSTRCTRAIRSPRSSPRRTCRAPARSSARCTSRSTRSRSSTAPTV